LNPGHTYDPRAASRAAFLLDFPHAQSTFHNIGRPDFQRLRRLSAAQPLAQSLPSVASRQIRRMTGSESPECLADPSFQRVSPACLSAADVPGLADDGASSAGAFWTYRFPSNDMSAGDATNSTAQTRAHTLANSTPAIHAAGRKKHSQSFSRQRRTAWDRSCTESSNSSFYRGPMGVLS